MVRNATPTFGLRLFFAFCVVIGILCVFRFYSLAIAVFAGTTLHFLLLIIGNKTAHYVPTRRNPILRNRFVRRVQTDDSAVLVTMGYLVFFYCWHMFAMLISPKDIQMIWNTSSVFDITSTTIEHSVVAAWHVFIYVKYVADCFGGGHVDPRSCAMTACLSVMLFATHFAIPHV